MDDAEYEAALNEKFDKELDKLAPSLVLFIEKFIGPAIAKRDFEEMTLVMNNFAAIAGLAANSISVFNEVLKQEDL